MTEPVQKRKVWARRLVTLLLMVAVFFGIRAWQQRDIVHGAAPLFSGVTLDGRPVSLEQYRGKPMLLHFWATWCPVCKLEQGSIDSVAEDYPVLTVATWSEDATAVAAYVKEHDIQAPVLVDEKGVLARRYGINGVPASFFLDGEGNVRHVEVGYTTEIGFRLRLWWRTVSDS